MPLARRDQNANTNASNPESAAMIEVPSPMITEQTDCNLELTRCKLEADMTAVEVETRLRRDQMVKESEARVAASVSAASTATTAAAPARRPMTDREEDITGKVPTEVMSITLRFAGLLQEEIVRIFQNKFKPINLYRSRYMHELQFDSLHPQDHIGIENSVLKLRKTSRTYKDFGNSFYEVWAYAFYNYTTILVFLLGRKVPDFHSALAQFYSNIYKLFWVYEWQEAVLPMAIEAHIFIVAQEPTDPSKWVIPEKFQGWFWTARIMIGMHSIMGADAKRKSSRSHKGVRRGKSSGSNNLWISCQLFNKGGCNWPTCNRAHICKDCGSMDHWLSECAAEGKKSSWQLVGGMEVVGEELKVVEVASLANRNNLYPFIRAYPCLLAPPRQNTIIKFRLADISKPSLTNLPSPLKPRALADLLARYPGSLRIHLPMVLPLGAELGYEGPDAFILSENLASSLTYPTMIEKRSRKTRHQAVWHRCTRPATRSSAPQ